MTSQYSRNLHERCHIMRRITIFLVSIALLKWPAKCWTTSQSKALFTVRLAYLKKNPYKLYYFCQQTAGKY
ncbi:hypothetical protein BKA66DRAFT_459813, partial [Pyrenochaeta sp. MPI-SDFR-AT-0127]